MSGEDYTKVHKRVETTLQLEDRLELLARFCSKEQESTVVNQDIIWKYNKGLSPKIF